MPIRTEDAETVSPAVAARLLGVSTRTLRRYADAGRLAVIVLPSGHRRYRTEDLDRLRAA